MYKLANNFSKEEALSPEGTAKLLTINRLHMKGLDWLK